jgi:hypothetical protein
LFAEVLVAERELLDFAGGGLGVAVDEPPVPRDLEADQVLPAVLGQVLA